MGNELRSIVHPETGGCWILLEKFLIGVDDIDTISSTAGTNGQVYSTVLIHNIDEPQFGPIRHLVELEVDCPHIVRVLGSQQPPGTVCWP
jgi:hypothetical protein